MRKFVLLIVIIIGIPIHAKSFTSLNIQSELMPEEYFVYKTILRKMFVGEFTKQLVLEGTTESDSFYKDYPNVRKKLIAQFNGTTEDFIEKNIKSFELNDKFNVGLKVNTLRGNERKELFDELIKRSDSYDEWTEVLNRKYSNGGTGIIRLSRVGFNADKNRALVLVGFQCGWTCGESNYILLEKKKGKWKIKRKVMKSIS